MKMIKEVGAKEKERSEFVEWGIPLKRLLIAAMQSSYKEDQQFDALRRRVEKWRKLLTINSLTMGLKSLGSPFEVEVLHLGNSGLFSDEIPAFKGNNDFSDKKLIYQAGETIFVREVFLKLSGMPVVWARSVIDLDAGNWLKILDCGTEPLGHRLFDGSLPITRSPFEYGVVDFYHSMFAQGTTLREQGFSEENGAIVARRSTFDWAGAPLLLTECYLPTLERFIERC